MRKSRKFRKFNIQYSLESPLFEQAEAPKEEEEREKADAPRQWEGFPTEEKHGQMPIERKVGLESQKD